MKRDTHPPTLTMNGMSTRNGALSPLSTDSQEWSPITRYQNIAGDNPYSPTIPPNAYGPSNPDGGMLNGMRPPTGNGNPSPPSSVGRSSDGAGLYASSLSDSTRPPMDSRRMQALEDTMSEHFRVLKAYLGPYLNDEKGNPRPSRAKDKLTRLSAVQFQELSTDVYDESIRREQDRKRGGPGAPGNETPKFLLPKNNFHPKRNQARQKLSTLPLERFRQLATDVFYELERRFPRFTNGDFPPRPSSPSGSIASRISNRGPPSRTGTPNSMAGRPPPGPGYRGPPPMGGPMGGPGGPPGPLRPGSNDSNSFGRPLPKTFQSNTIVPNKGTLVEDDDDSGADDDDAFNLEGAAARRQTNKSAKSMSMAQEKMTTDLQKQVSELQGKLGSLESTLRDKDEELDRLRDADRTRDGSSASERAEWDQLRLSLEEKVDKAEDLNSSLRSEIDRLRSENEGVESSLRAQIANLESRPPQQASDSGDGDGQWRRRCEELEQELSEQQQVAEEVRRDASMFLQEMKELSARSDAAAEKEEQMANKISSLETELKEWKSRYARAKTQLRNLKASSMGLAQLTSNDLANYTRDASFTSPDGLVKDVHVTKFQLSIDELLQIARRGNSEQTLDSMRHVVKCVRAITSDIDSTSSLSQLQSPTSSVGGDMLATPERQQAKLKSRVSATANNLITATKNHAASGGLSPVSLLDAAASHLSTAVVELVKHVKVRPTPEDELEGDNDEDNDRPMPLKPAVYSSYGAFSPNNTNGNSSNGTSTYGHHRSRSSKGGSSDTTGYSTYSSPYSGYDRQSAAMNGMNGVKNSGILEFKNYLEDQTALLVQSIQPLVNLIRSTPESTPEEEQRIYEYIQDIAEAVDDTCNKTYEAVNQLSNPALKKHAIPVVEVLDDCRQNMLAINVRDGGRERVPPLAFKTARALKELVLRVDRIESSELTVDQTLQVEL